MIRFLRTWARHTIQALRPPRSTLPAPWEIRQYLRLIDEEKKP